MSSWSLLRHLIAFWERGHHPIFRRETARPPVWQGATLWASRATGAALMLAGLCCYLHLTLAFYVDSLLLLAVPLVVLWTLLLGATLAPVIVLERQDHTWETLRTTPLRTETIILDKTAGALWRLRDIIRPLIGLVLLASSVMGFYSLTAPSALDAATPGDWPGSALCAGFVLPLTGAFLFVVDRAQQFVLTAMAALAVSSSSRSLQVAVPGAGGVAIAVWLLDVGVAGLFLSLQPDRANAVPILRVATLGPAAAYLTEFSSAYTALAVSGTLLLRELAVRILWYWTVHAASRL